MVIRRTILWWMLLCGTALAQSNPGFVKGQVPTAAQWNSYFTSKTDTTNGTLVNPSISGASQLTGTVSGTPDFLGNVTFSGAAIFGAGGTLSGTFGGNPTLTGTWSGGTQTGADVSGNNVTATDATQARTNAAMAADVVNALGSTGVDRTGTTDSTTGLAAACTAAASAGKVLYIPAGTYLIDGLSLTSCSIRGDGAGNTVLKRQDNAVSAPAIAVASLGGFTWSDLTVDGNKANQTVTANNIAFTADWNFTLVRVESKNAKSGFGLRIVATADATHGTISQVLYGVMHDNDSDGLDETGAAQDLQIIGGSYFLNGGTGILLQNPVFPPVASSINRPVIRGVSAYLNGGSGISVGSFCGSLSSASCVAGYDQLTADNAIISDNQVFTNGRYGITAQVNHGTVTGNHANNNGCTISAGTCTPTTGGTYAGILGNAAYTKFSHNQMLSNEYYGIDAGGCYYCDISDNDAGYNGINSAATLATGINLEASQYTIVHDNHSHNNGNASGGIQIRAAYYGINGAGNAFTFTATDNIIHHNRVERVNSSGYGIWVDGDPTNTVVTDNSCDGLGASLCYVLQCTTCVIRGNMYDDAFPFAFVGDDASLIMPDGYDRMILNSSTGANLTGIYTNFVSSYLGAAYKLVITARGSGYTSPTVSLPGGATATLYLDQTGGVGAALITAKGSGISCSAGCSETISDGTGSGATAVLYSDPWGQINGREIQIDFTAATPQLITPGSRQLTPSNANVSLVAKTSIKLTGWGTFGGGTNNVAWYVTNVTPMQ